MNSIVKDLFINTDYDQALAKVSFTTPDGFNRCRWEVLDGERVAGAGGLDLEPGKCAAFGVALPGFKPWHVDTPLLYRLRLELSGTGDTEAVEETFGMRKLSATPEGVFVNNAPFLIRGYIRGREAHDHENLANLPLEEFYAKQFAAAKDYGFNFVRFHSRIPPEECLQAADRLGMFVHVEIRKYYGKYQKERFFMDDHGLVDEKDWREAILRIRNHPSLMFYCLGNEIRHPGVNPRVEYLAGVTRELDTSRFFIDTCAHGEVDRTYVDVDVQHMSYFFPFGKDYDMYDNTYNWRIYGSAKGTPLTEAEPGEEPAWRVNRTLTARCPVLAHEICHYVAWRDLEALDRKFKKAKAAKPWWIDELKKLVELKGMKTDYAKCMEASQRFQFLGWKLGIEAARRSKILSGFHFLQFCDTERYENSNGIVDCFDDNKGIDRKGFLSFNAESVVLSDLPRRTFFEDERLMVPIIVSHFDPAMKGEAELRFRLKCQQGGKVLLKGALGKMDMNRHGRYEIANLDLRLPAVSAPEALVLECEIKGKECAIRNSWNLWLYPNRPAVLPGFDAVVALDEVNLGLRYPQIRAVKSAKLMIANRFSEALFKHLEKGGDALLLYRVPETRDRRDPGAPVEKYYLPATWDRLKGVVWDRGHNCGAFARPGKALVGFPNDGFLDLQYYGIVDDSDKICLDDFPVAVDPILQGVDKAARDRFDIHDYQLSELQPAYTMRKFAYLFELRVGRGRLLVSGFNFTGLNRGVPEAAGMFESLVRYVRGGSFKPAATITVKAMRDYLAAKGKAPRIHERKMTQYWQLNEEPLESAKYWREANEYIDGKGRWEGRRISKTGNRKDK
jgi:hypothetical protein